MSTLSPSPDCHLLIFGRYPVPGTTKTRLIPALGSVGAAECQRILTEKTVITARLFSVEHHSVEHHSGEHHSGEHQSGEHQSVTLLFHHFGGTPRQLRNWIGKKIEFYVQIPGTLGDKMYDAIYSSFQREARKVVLIGTDLPALTPLHLSTAFEALNDHEIVLGPAEDGGYWLVGMRHPLDIFKNIPWGTETVLSRTIESARKLKIKPFLLASLNDLDRPDDFDMNSDRDSAAPKILISVIIPTINESSRIASAIASAEHPNSEIIVVDGGSCDDTAAIAGKSGARVITAAGGRAYQQNRGAGAARGKIVLFLHADTLLPSNYAASVFTAFLDKTCMAGAFSFQTDSIHPLMRLIAMGVNLRSRYLKLPYGDQALFFRASAFKKNGGFPLTPIAEDLMMIRQMKKRGKIAILRNCVSTSGRRWKQIGIIRTTLINLIILTGILLGCSPERFAGLYGIRS